MLELYGAHPKRPSLQAPPAKIGILDQIGRETREPVNESNTLDFIGDSCSPARRQRARPAASIGRTFRA
jgi:hypothetical protein